MHRPSRFLPGGRNRTCGVIPIDAKQRGEPPKCRGRLVCALASCLRRLAHRAHLRQRGTLYNHLLHPDTPVKKVWQGRFNVAEGFDINVTDPICPVRALLVAKLG
jgi:hypothetical protein